MNSREKIMEMVKDGTLSVEEGLLLLDAIEELSLIHSLSSAINRRTGTAAMS